MNTAVAGITEYDPFAKEVMDNPLPFYEWLRKHHPAYYMPKYDTFVFSRFDDIVQVLSIGDNAFVATDTTLPDPKRLLKHNNGRVEELPLDPLPIGTLLASPHFEILRRAHIASLRPKAVASLTSLIQKMTDERLDVLLPKKQFDLTQEYGGIVAAGAVCHLLDMPLSLAPQVLHLVNQCSLTDPEKGGTDISVSIGRCVELMMPYIAKRRESGADGSVPMIDGLINLDHYGRPLTDAEVATQLVCEFIGGTETVPKICAHGLMELAAAPDQLRAVRQDLERNVPIAVEEMIRYCAPAQWFVRTAHKDLTVAGQDIKIGQRVLVLFGSAARDDAEFDRPNEFIWNRPIKRVLSFGFGQHHCTGIHLARLELRILVRSFLERVKDYSFDLAHATRFPSSFQWGWNSLPVIIS